MIDKNLILYLPFDDPEGNTAYDYSQSRKNATLSNGATFSKIAKKGKSLSLNSGEALSLQDIPFKSDFTLSFYVMPQNTSKIGWLINFEGMENYEEEWYDVIPNEWIFFVFVKLNGLFRVYKDSSLVYEKTFEANPVGLSLNDESIGEVQALIDDLQLYNIAKTPAEVYKMQSDTSDIEYFIDGQNFKEFGVYVSESDGLFGRLALKDSLQVDWDTYHGIVRDKNHPRYKEREISLKCFIEADSRTKFVQWQKLFLEQFDGAGTHRLTVQYSGTAQPLVYEIFISDEVAISKTWGRYDEGLMVGTFTLKMTEDEPVKRVLRHIGSDNSSCTITISTTKKVNIYWGDGTHTYNVSGTNKTVTHKYSKGGEYDIIISGVIEDITSFSTNAIILWNLLK